MVSAYWDPILDPGKEHDHGGYFPGTIVSYNTIGSSKYGPIRTYHIKYDDGDELEDIQDYWIFSKRKIMTSKMMNQSKVTYWYNTKV